MNMLTNQRNIKALKSFLNERPDVYRYLGSTVYEWYNGGSSLTQVTFETENEPDFITSIIITLTVSGSNINSISIPVTSYTDIINSIRLELSKLCFKHVIDEFNIDDYICKELKDTFIPLPETVNTYLQYNSWLKNDKIL